MLIHGTVLKTDRIVGKNDRGPYDFTQVHVLDGIAVHVATVGREFGEIPTKGEQILAEVNVTPRKNRTSGAADVSITLVRRLTASEVDDLASLTALAAA